MIIMSPIFTLHFPFQIQLVNNVKIQRLVSQGEVKLEEITNSLLFRYRATPHLGVKSGRAITKSPFSECSFTF